MCIRDRFLGGKAARSPQLWRNHDMDGQGVNQATVEALALALGLDYIRKTLLATAANNERLHIIIITDRMAMLRTMQLSQASFPQSTDANWMHFHCGLHLATIALTKLCYTCGSVTVLHKNQVPSMASKSPDDWVPDILARVGCDTGGTPIQLPNQASCFHCLRFTDEHWSAKGPVSYTHLTLPTTPYV